MAGRSLTLSEESWAANTDPAKIRCSAKYKTGERCRRVTVLGAPVCKNHGGHLPVVQQKAATRIGMSLDDAVKKLVGMLDDPQVQHREKVKILHDLLDRGGLGAVSKVAVGISAADPVEQLFRELLNTPGMLAPATSEAPPQYVQDDWESSPLLELGTPDVVDAEVVEESSTPTPGWPATDLGETGRTPPRLRESMERTLKREGLW